MTEEILERLRQKAKKLDQRSAEINGLIEEREKELVEMGLGVEAEIQIRAEATTYLDPQDGVERNASENTHFGFGKKTGAWGFYIQRRTLMARGMPPWVPTVSPYDWGTSREDAGGVHHWDLVRQDDAIALRSASRDLRLQSMSLFGDLLIALEKRADQMIQMEERLAGGSVAPRPRGLLCTLSPDEEPRFQEWKKEFIARGGLPDNDQLLAIQFREHLREKK